MFDRSKQDAQGRLAELQLEMAPVEIIENNMHSKWQCEEDEALQMSRR